jgi:hypothetical protein
LESGAEFNDAQQQANTVRGRQKWLGQRSAPLNNWILVKAKRKKKRSRAQPRKTGFGGFRKLTRNEVEWLKQDSKKALKRAEEAAAQRAAPPVASNVTEESANKEELLEAERFFRHLRLATAVNLVVNGALNRSKWCGVFLGEIIPFLARKEPELMANEHFKRRISEMRSAQKARKKGRTLRTEIEQIIQEARRLRDTAKYQNLWSDARKEMKDLERRAKLLKKEEFNVSSKGLDDLRDRLSRVETAAKDEALQKLPEFSLHSADQWFEQVVWPELQQREPSLRNNPLIGELKKANKSGKFQLSDLKTQAQQTVRRIAVLPRAYYFW